MNRIAWARVVSIVGHPFTFIVLLMLPQFWMRGESAALRITGIVVFAGLLPLGLFMWHRYASGQWQTVDASARTDRPTLFLAVFALILPLGLYFLFVEHSLLLIRGCSAIAVISAVAAVLNQWIKLSLHLALAGFAALILGRINLGFGIPIGLFIPLLAWSRLVLLRHTFPEVIGGLALGLIVAAMLILS